MSHTMPLNVDAPAHAAAPPASDVCVWKAHPARSNPLRGAMALLVVLAAGWGVQAWVALPGWSIAAGCTAALLLFLNLNRFFLPSRFEMDDEGITARYALSSRRFLWKDVRRFAHDDDGGILTTRRRPSRLDPWKGLHLLFDGRGATLIPRIKGHLDACPSDDA